MCIIFLEIFILEAFNIHVWEFLHFLKHSGLYVQSVDVIQVSEK